jgi:hypothetical protein
MWTLWQRSGGAKPGAWEVTVGGSGRLRLVAWSACTAWRARTVDIWLGGSHGVLSLPGCTIPLGQPV